MKYCMLFDSNSKYSVPEIKINVSSKTDVLMIPLFVEEHPNQRTIAMIRDIDDFILNDRLAAIAPRLKDKNISFCCSHYKDMLFSKLKDFADYMKRYELSFFFEKPIVDWDTLWAVLLLGVSDMYIAERMGFELPNIKDIANRYNCQIRTYIDVCQSSVHTFDPVFSFWIRPEDIDFYGQYIDVIERYQDGDTIQNDTYYEIFMIQKKWSGDLGEIISGLEDSGLDSRCMLPSWNRRAYCEKRCLKGSPCRLCHQAVKLARDLKKEKLIITPN